MKLTEDNKKHIDSLSYTQLFSKFRFAPIGDPWFAGETGDYWSKRMRELRSQEGGDERHVKTSKALGFDIPYGYTLADTKMQDEVSMLNEAFSRNVIAITKDDTLVFKCIKGLWSVSGNIKDRDSLEAEAKHYFVQYQNDGEYDEDGDHTPTAFTDDMAKPFTTIRCPKCGYRGQVTSEWAPLSGKKMAGECDWCEHKSKVISKSEAETDFLVETWVKDK